MTREEAREELIEEWNVFIDGCGLRGIEEKEAKRNPDFKKVYEANLMAIQALEQEPCEDAISRQAVLDLLEDTNNGWIINEVLQLPSVKPQDCDTCEVGNPCLYCKHEFEPQERSRANE